MCDLFGLSCNEKDRATRSLPVFANYSKINDDGWGIAYYKDNKPIIRRKPEKAKMSQQFFKMIEEAKSNIIIAHIRLATQGDICKENCHPFKQYFQNKDWVFAHNGHVAGITRHSRSEGETDSEQVFNFILDQIHEYQNQGQIRGVYPGLIKGIKKVFEVFSRNINLNFLLSDGSILYAFNHYTGKPIYFLKREKDYGGAFLISTHKLSNENWKILPSDRLLLITRGNILVLSGPI